MKKFQYFFVLYLLIVLIGTRFFYVFSSQEIENLILNLNEDTQTVDVDPDIVLEESQDDVQSDNLSQDSQANLIVDDQSNFLEISWDIQIIPSDQGLNWSQVLDQEISQDGWQLIQNLDYDISETLQQDTIQILDSPSQDINLSITEVFYDGTDEWIEITNFASQSFSGTVLISWVKSVWVSVDLQIQANQSLVLWDNCLMISDLAIIYKTWLAMSISDTNPINIYLFHSWVELDRFIVDSNLVSQYNNTNTSFEKVLSNSILTVTWTTLDRAQNVIVWYIANPWLVQTISGWWSIGTGALAWESSLPNLKLTEVFYDGTDEWIEITNMGTWIFMWNLKINWASASPFEIDNISIQPDRSIIISDNNKHFADDSSVIIKTISISDTSAINISLFYSWNLLDSLNIPKNFVNDINNQKTSFEKVISNWNIVTTITNTGRIYNLKSEYISWWYIANPWKVWQVDENITDISTDSSSTNIDLSWLILPINCNDFASNPFQIVEIFAGDSQTSTYIELLGLQNFSGLVLFSGQWLSWNFYVNVDIIAWERILITKSLQGILDEQKNIENPSLELVNNWWWVEIYGQSGLILDIVYYINFGTAKSSYFDGLYSSCARVLNKYDSYSPGFKETLLSYFPQWKTVYQDKIVYLWWWGWSCPTYSGNIDPPINTWSDVDIDLDVQHYSQIEITYIDYNPEWSDIDNESVVLQSLTTQDIQLKDYRLQVVGKSTKKTIKWDILSGLSSKTFVGNYQFPNTDSCINLLYKDIIVDTYCYSDSAQLLSNVNTGQDWSEIFTGTQNFTWNFEIKILDIDYDPDWSDTNNEKITLRLDGVLPVNLSSFKLRINKDSKTSKKSIPWILSPWFSQTLIGNYQFPNSTNDWKNVVVSLVMEDKYILDTYSYNPNIPKNLPKPGTYKVYSVTDGDTIKIQNWDKNISIRLLWVDAPESSKTRFGHIECFGPQAKDYLKWLIDKKDIMLQYDESQIVDSYKRILWYVFLAWENINKQIIQNWYAREYTHNNNIYQYQSNFVSAQTFAQQNWLWLWSNSTCSWQRMSVWSWINQVETWVILTWDLNIQITSILPNPKWSDKWNEKITLIYIPKISPNLDQDLDLDQKIQDEYIDLSQKYYLLIWTRKKYLTWILYANQQTIFTGDFAFPNSASCVSIAKDNIILDTMCYQKPWDGIEFSNKNWVLESISTMDLSILKSSKLQNIGSNLCMTYQWQIIQCKKLPSTKTSIKNQNKIRLYENYLWLLDGYLKNNRQVLFYNTDMKNYFNLLNEAKKNISAGIYYIDVDWETIQTTDISKRYEMTYNQNNYDYLIQNFRSKMIWANLIKKYKKLKEEYWKHLEESRQ